MAKLSRGLNEIRTYTEQFLTHCGVFLGADGGLFSFPDFIDFFSVTACRMEQILLYIYTETGQLVQNIPIYILEMVQSRSLKHGFIIR